MFVWRKYYKIYFMYIFTLPWSLKQFMQIWKISQQKSQMYMCNKQEIRRMLNTNSIVEMKRSSQKAHSFFVHFFLSSPKQKKNLINKWIIIKVEKSYYIKLNENKCVFFYLLIHDRNNITREGKLQTIRPRIYTKWRKNNR